METVNIKKELDAIDNLWNPKVIAELNGQQVKIAKVKGEFIWHSHKNEDELFYILKGKLIIELRHKNIQVNQGEMVVIPKGMEHRPVAKQETWIMLFEPENTKKTGDAKL